MWISSVQAVSEKPRARTRRPGFGDRCTQRLRRYAAMLATLLVLTVSGVPCQLAAQKVEGTDTRPNILVFISDNMGWGQPGFNGGTEVATPNMDRIANEGIKLTQFYVQPVCSPTRASLMTGRYAWKKALLHDSTAARVGALFQLLVQDTTAQDFGLPSSAIRLRM